MPRPIHVPTEEELEALYRRQQDSIVRWQHALKLSEDVPHLPTSLDVPLSREQYLAVKQWVSSFNVVRHRKALVMVLSRRLLRASEIRRLFLEGKLN